MKVKFGGTRVIFIFKDFVIKIPRFRIVRSILRFFYYLKNKQVEERLEYYNKKSMMIAILKYFFLGLIANRLEYYYSKKHRNFGEIVPVYGILFGMIIIQKRVVVMKEEDEQWKEFEESLLKKG